MRKLTYLITVVVLSLISITAFAQDQEQVTKVVQQKKMEISLDQIPEMVAKALTIDFKGYSVGKAYRYSKDGQLIYIIQLSKDKETVEASYNTEGETVQL